jgi:hypothetical protein
VTVPSRSRARATPGRRPAGHSGLVIAHAVWTASRRVIPRRSAFPGMARIALAIYWGAERPSLLRLPVIPPNTE